MSSLDSSGATALYDQLVEAVHDAAAIFLDGQREGLGVVEDGLFAQVGPDHLWYEGIDALVVGDAEVGGKDGLDLPRRLRLGEPGQVVVDPTVLYSLVDDVEPAPTTLVHQVPVTVELDLVPLRQDGAELALEDLVVQVVLVVGAGGEDGERGVRRP
jgi:hypothetical protein